MQRDCPTHMGGERTFVLLDVDHRAHDPGERGGVVERHEREHRAVRVPLHKRGSPRSALAANRYERALTLQ